MQHEKASQDMFDHLVENNHLIGDMVQHGLVPEEDRLFIKELIDPKVEEIAEVPICSALEIYQYNLQPGRG